MASARRKERRRRAREQAPVETAELPPQTEEVEVFVEPDKKPLLVFQRVPDEFLQPCWMAFVPYLERACARSGGRYSVEAIAEGLFERAFQLWAATELDGTPRGVMVTHIMRYPTGLQVAQILMVAGDGIGFANAQAIMGKVDAWARENDCREVEYLGRKGFLRMMKGWKPLAVAAYREL